MQDLRYKISKSFLMISSSRWLSGHSNHMTRTVDSVVLHDLPE